MQRYLCLLALLPTALPLACDPKGSLGDYEGSGSGGASFGGTDSGQTQTGGSGSASSGNGSASESDADAGGIRLDIGNGEFVCDNPDYQCDGPAPGCGPGSECGGLESPFDDLGCMRQSCAVHSACAASQLCYRPEEWGGCASSGQTCTEESGTCTCVATPDCGGGYCVPRDIYPSVSDFPLQPGPTSGRAHPACAPNDGFALEMVFEVADPACSNQDVSDAELQITIWGGFPAPNVVGSFLLDDGSGGFARWNGIDSSDGVVRLTASDEDTISGEYEIRFDDGLVGTTLIGTFSLPYCDLPAQCG